MTPTEAALMREELAEKSAAAGERYQAQVAEATRRRASQLEEVREAFPREDLASKISTEDFQALLENEFPEAGEAALLSALRTTLSGRIVRDLEVRRLEDDLRRGIQVSEDGRAAKPVRGVLDFVGEDTARQEARESLRRKLLAVDVDFSLEVQRAFTTLVELLVAPNFSYDSRATVELKVEAARNVPRESTESYKKGQVVLRGGERRSSLHCIGPHPNERNRDSHTRKTNLARDSRFCSLAAPVVLGTGGERDDSVVEGAERRRVFWPGSRGVLALIKASLVLTTGFLQVWHGVPESALLFGIPFALGPMLVRLFLGVPAATAFALILCGLVGVLVQDESVGGLAQFLPQTLVFYSLVSGLIGAYSMFEIRERSTLLRASFIVGVTNVITGAVFLMLHGVDFLAEGLWVMGGGLFGACRRTFS